MGRRLCNSAETLIYGTERTLQEFGDKLDPGRQGRLQTALDECKRTLEMFAGKWRADARRLPS